MVTAKKSGAKRPTTASRKPKSAASNNAPKPMGRTSVPTVPAAGEERRKLKKKEIYEHVAMTTGLSKSDVRDILDCGFDFIRVELSKGKDAQIPPLGKIRVVIQNAGTEKEKTIYKAILSDPEAVRRNKEKREKQALAASGE